MTHRRVAVVMPAYNEASGIGGFLEEICAAFRSANMEAVIGVVDDCSSDQTRFEVTTFGDSGDCEVSVVSNHENLGHGPSSVRAWHLGLSFETPVVVHVDGDGQFDGDDIVQVAKACLGADGAIGIRAQRTDPWFRRLVTLSLRRYIRVMSGVYVEDANSPMRAYKSTALKPLLASLPESPLIPSVYLSVAGIAQKLNIVGVEVTSHDRRGDTATGSTWGEARLPLIPSRRLVVFVWNAARESFRVLRYLRSRAEPPPS